MGALNIRNPNELDLVPGRLYWAGYAKNSGGYPAKQELVVVPVKLEGEAPFFGLVTPKDVYASEWWLLSVANMPSVDVVFNDTTKSIESVTTKGKFTEYPETHAQGNLTVENDPFQSNGVDLPALRDCDFGVQIAADGRVWVCVNGFAFLRFSPHPDGRMSPPVALTNEALAT